MSGELTSVATDVFAALDAQDVDRLVGFFAEDPRGIDEISRRWLRGRAEAEEYVRGLVGAVDDIHSELHDVDEQNWGDTGVVTCWLEQSYTMNSQPMQVSCPTTLVLRREGGEWKVSLIHSLPLPEQE